MLQVDGFKIERDIDHLLQPQRNCLLRQPPQLTQSPEMLAAAVLVDASVQHSTQHIDLVR